MATSYAIITKTKLVSVESPLIFETLSGDLTVIPLPQQSVNEPLLLEMNFPLGNPKPLHSVSEPYTDLLQALGAPLDSKILDIQFCANTRKLLLIFEELQSILSLSPVASKLLEVFMFYFSFLV